jgi:hypothetical protein
MRHADPTKLLVACRGGERGGGAEPCGTDRGGGRSSLTAAAVVWIGSWWLGVREREEGSKLREVVLMGSK